MLNFYPGPSKLDPLVKESLGEIVASGILSQNHRSKAFMDLYASCKAAFAEYMQLPEGYQLYFCSSATEAWEIVNQSLLHDWVQFYYHGAFGKKWFKYAVTNKGSAYKEIRGSRFSLEEYPTLHPSAACYCYVHTETSNGFLLEPPSFPKDSFVFVDATSSMGGCSLNWETADVWLASSQKCLGLPSGMGLLVVSPRMIEKAHEINERNHYNSFLFIHENAVNNQTHLTPNILGIALLEKLCRSRKPMSQVNTELFEQMRDLREHARSLGWQPLIQIEQYQSPTVLTIATTPEQLKHIFNLAETFPVILGKGYGEWKDSTFRIANFPAHSKREIQELKNFLQICS